MWNAPRTLYIGFDWSLNSPGICSLLEIEGGESELTFGYYHKEKISGFSDNMIWLGDPSRYKNGNQFVRYEFLRDSALRFVKTRGANSWHHVNVSIEGYSYGSKGFTFEIGENSGFLISGIRSGFKGCVPIKIPPSAVKKEGTGRGNASKEEMVQAFMIETGIDLIGSSGFQTLKSPLSDIADSYYVMKAGKKIFESDNINIK